MSALIYVVVARPSDPWSKPLKKTVGKASELRRLLETGQLPLTGTRLAPHFSPGVDTRGFSIRSFQENCLNLQLALPVQASYSSEAAHHEALAIWRTETEDTLRSLCLGELA